MRLTIVSITLFAHLCLACFSANAGNPTRFNWAHVYETSEPLHKWAVWAAEQISQRTGGRYHIDVFPASQLGKEIHLNQGLSLGTVDIIYTGTSFTSQFYAPIGLADIPYAFTSYQHWQAYRDSTLFKRIKQEYRLASKGNVIVGYTYYGQRHVTSNRPIRTPQDMQNMKIRVPNAPAFRLFPLAVNAKPTPIAFSEVYLALQQGVVDGQENPLPTIKAKKFHEVQTHITLTGHLTGSNLIVASEHMLRQLAPADRKIFLQVMEQAAAGVSTDTRTAELSLINWFRQQGNTVNQIEISPFRQATLPFHQTMLTSIGQEYYDELQALQTD